MLYSDYNGRRNIKRDRKLVVQGVKRGVDELVSAHLELVEAQRRMAEERKAAQTDQLEREHQQIEELRQLQQGEEFGRLFTGLAGRDWDRDLSSFERRVLALRSLRWMEEIRDRVRRGGL